MGHLELIGNASIFVSRANASISISRNSVNSKLCRPTRHSHGAAHCIPDGPRRANWLTIAAHEVGPCEGLFNRRFWRLWANTSSSETSAQIPLTENSAGPHDILVAQLIVLPMGQSESNV